MNRIGKARRRDIRRDMARVVGPPVAITILWALAMSIAIFVLGCSGVQTADRVTIVTELGLEAAEEQYHAAYMQKLEQCKADAPAETEAAEKCFGEWAKVDEEVRVAVYAAVGILRTYWTARAHGEEPDWVETMSNVKAILDDLPPIAKRYFERIEGVPL